MESMGNKSNGAHYRCWKIVLDIERFITDNADETFITRKTYFRNYLKHLLHLMGERQIIIQRNGGGEIIGICGWARYNKEDEYKINKVTWALPENITEGENLYISFCVLNGGSMGRIRKRLKELYSKQINEVYWFNIPTNDFTRRRNILKENVYANQ